MKKILSVIRDWFIVIVIVVGFCYIMHASAKKMGEKSRQGQKERAAYYRRLPNKGDKVELDGEVVTIVKHGQFLELFTVRYSDGTLSQASEKEMLDKEVLPD